MSTGNRSWVDYLLCLLLAVGSIGAVKVSYENLLGNSCPHVAFVPICYVVLIAYLLMVLSVIINHKGCRHYFFIVGWSIATAIALIGSVSEFLAGGGVCPSSGGGSIRGATSSGAVPLCYVSLALLVVILVLFVLGPYKRTCDIANGKPGGTAI